MCIFLEEKKKKETNFPQNELAGSGNELETFHKIFVEGQDTSQQVSFPEILNFDIPPPKKKGKNSWLVHKMTARFFRSWPLLGVFFRDLFRSFSVTSIWEIKRSLDLEEAGGQDSKLVDLAPAMTPD